MTEATLKSFSKTIFKKKKKKGNCLLTNITHLMIQKIFQRVDADSGRVEPYFPFITHRLLCLGPQDTSIPLAMLALHLHVTMLGESGLLEVEILLEGVPITRRASNK